MLALQAREQRRRQLKMAPRWIRVVPVRRIAMRACGSVLPVPLPFTLLLARVSVIAIGAAALLIDVECWCGANSALAGHEAQEQAGSDHLPGVVHGGEVGGQEGLGGQEDVPQVMGGVGSWGRDTPDLNKRRKKIHDLVPPVFRVESEVFLVMMIKRDDVDGKMGRKEDGGRRRGKGGENEERVYMVLQPFFMRVCMVLQPFFMCIVYWHSCSTMLTGVCVCARARARVCARAPVPVPALVIVFVVSPPNLKGKNPKWPMVPLSKKLKMQVCASV